MVWRVACTIHWGRGVACRGVAWCGMARGTIHEVLVEQVLCIHSRPLLCDDLHHSVLPGKTLSVDTTYGEHETRHWTWRVGAPTRMQTAPE